MKFAAAFISPLAFAGLGGCVAVDAAAPGPGLSCAVGETRQPVALLTFGRNIGQTVGVSEADFTRFLDEDVTPRFPDGLTVQDSEGRWFYKGVLYKEPGKVLMLILRHPQDRAKLAEIAAAYERRYRQDSVLIRVRPECVLFHMAPGR
jgi:hypothetical protein